MRLRTLPAALALAALAACGKDDSSSTTADATAPVVALDPIAAFVSAPALTVKGTVTDPGGGTPTLAVEVDGTSVATPVPAAGGAFTANVTLTAGAHVVTVVATDADGNSGVAAASVTFGLACATEATALLRLRSVVAAPTGLTNADLVKEEGASKNLKVYVDARAGGSSVPQSYTYAKFTANGLVPVALTDVDAATSNAWDVAFRRSGIRVNSGVSGPSTVKVAKADTSAVAAGATWQDTLAAKFAAVTSATGLTYKAEDYFTQACAVAQDSHGNGSPNFLTQAWWDYTNGCLAVTGEVFVLQLADGQHVKLQVLSYYEPTVQGVCNTTPTSFDPFATTNGSAQFRITWAFL